MEPRSSCHRARSARPARRRRSWPAALGLAALAAVWLLAVGGTLAAPGCLANGGTARLVDRPAGPYVVSVFTDPTPLVTGAVDLSVLVRTPAGTVVDGAQVNILAAKPGSDAASAIRQPATRDAATNKLYYAAKFRIGEPGRWRFAIDVAGPAGQGTVEFEADVEQAGALDQPVILAVLLVVPALGISWWVWRSRKPRG